MHPHKCIQAYNTHTPLAQKWVSTSHSLSEAQSRRKQQHGALTQACCTAPSPRNTQRACTHHRGFLQAQRRPWNSSRPWCCYQPGKGIHLNQCKWLSAWTRQPRERQLHGPLGSAGEERGFCLDPARNKSKDEESCILVPVSAFSCTKGSCSLGTKPRKVNSRVNSKTREGTEVFSKQKAKTSTVYRKTARDAPNARSSAKGMS